MVPDGRVCSYKTLGPRGWVYRGDNLSTSSGGASLITHYLPIEAHPRLLVVMVVVMLKMVVVVVLLKVLLAAAVIVDAAAVQPRVPRARLLVPAASVEALPS